MIAVLFNIRQYCVCRDDKYEISHSNGTLHRNINPGLLSGIIAALRLVYLLIPRDSPNMRFHRAAYELELLNGRAGVSRPFRWANVHRASSARLIALANLWIISPHNGATTAHTCKKRVVRTVPSISPDNRPFNSTAFGVFERSSNPFSSFRAHKTLGKCEERVFFFHNFTRAFALVIIEHIVTARHCFLAGRRCLSR